MNLYDFTVKAQDGSDIRLSSYKSKTVLVVNTATQCGFTPQYEPLQELYDECHEAGLEILDFPCNQFGAQAPGTNDEIHTFCTGRFGITFPQFDKVDVNGENAIALYHWLTSSTKFEGFGINAMAAILNPICQKMDPDYKNNGKIKWNFTKFLISKDGEILERFEPTADMKKVAEKVKAAL